MYTPTFGVNLKLAFYFIYQNRLGQSKIYHFNLHYNKLYKICMLSHC